MNQPVVQPLVLPERWDLVSDMAKTIAQLKADVAAQKKIVAEAEKVALAAEKKSIDATVKMDPAFGVTLAQQTLAATKPGSQEYIAALSNLTEAKNTVTLGPRPADKPGFIITRVGNEWRYISDGTGGGGTGGTGGTGTGGTGGGTTPPIPAAKTGPTLASDTFKATLALFFGQAEMAKPWVNELYNVTSKYYKTGSTIDESFNLALQDSRKNPELTEFTKRFQGIYALQDKKAAGQAVTVPTIAEYYTSQAKMGDVIRQAGLGSIATEDYLGGLIGKGLSVTDVGNYIGGIYNEIQNLPKDIKDSVMTNYPNMDSVSLAKAILTGDKGFVQLQKELTSQTIFGAAKRQGLAYDKILNPGGVTMDRATEYAAEGLDLATGLTKFGQVAGALPTISKLSQITANKDLALTQANLESAVIKKTASEIRKMEQLTEEELGRYRGSSGTSKVSFKGQSGLI